MIYFVQASDGGPIKIGYTNKPAKYVNERISGIQNGNPKRLEILIHVFVEGGNEVMKSEFTPADISVLKDF